MAVSRRGSSPPSRQVPPSPRSRRPNWCPPSPARPYAASPPGDVVGKITVGYQGWFACAGDGAPINGWWHWSHNWGQPPSPSNNAIVSLAGHARLHPQLPDGVRRTSATASRRTLFSSYDQQTVDTHFRWMQQNGCDTAALQRFNPFGGEGPTRDAMAAKVRSAAEAYGRKFYIMYDVTNWTNMQSEIKTDWTTKMSALHRRRRRTPGRTASRSSASGASASTTPAARSRRRLPGRRQLVQGPGLLRDRRRADATGGTASTTRGPASSTSTTRST